eukprot:Platyproteum_vivax@DN7296_c0_g1_i2.p1
MGNHHLHNMAIIGTTNIATFSNFEPKIRIVQTTPEEKTCIVLKHLDDVLNKNNYLLYMEQFRNVWRELEWANLHGKLQGKVELTLDLSLGEDGCLMASGMNALLHYVQKTQLAIVLPEPYFFKRASNWLHSSKTLVFQPALSAFAHLYQHHVKSLVNQLSIYGQYPSKEITFKEIEDVPKDAIYIEATFFGDKTESASDYFLFEINGYSIHDNLWKRKWKRLDYPHYYEEYKIRQTDLVGYKSHRQNPIDSAGINPTHYPDGVVQQAGHWMRQLPTGRKERDPYYFAKAVVFGLMDGFTNYNLYKGLSVNDDPMKIRRWVETMEEGRDQREAEHRNEKTNQKPWKNCMRLILDSSAESLKLDYTKRPKLIDLYLTTKKKKIEYLKGFEQTLRTLFQNFADYKQLRDNLEKAAMMELTRELRANGKLNGVRETFSIRMINIKRHFTDQHFELLRLRARYILLLTKTDYKDVEPSDVKLLQGIKEDQTDYFARAGIFLEVYKPPYNQAEQEIELSHKDDKPADFWRKLAAASSASVDVSKELEDWFADILWETDGLPTIFIPKYYEDKTKAKSDLYKNWFQTKTNYEFFQNIGRRDRKSHPIAILGIFMLTGVIKQPSNLFKKNQVMDVNVKLTLNTHTLPPNTCFICSLRFNNYFVTWREVEEMLIVRGFVDEDLSRSELPHSGTYKRELDSPDTTNCKSFEDLFVMVNHIKNVESGPVPELTYYSLTQN